MDEAAISLFFFFFFFGELVVGVGGLSREWYAIYDNLNGWLVVSLQTYGFFVCLFFLPLLLLFSLSFLSLFSLSLFSLSFLSLSAVSPLFPRVLFVKKIKAISCGDDLLFFSLSFSCKLHFNKCIADKSSVYDKHSVFQDGIWALGKEHIRLNHPLSHKFFFSF